MQILSQGSSSLTVQFFYENEQTIPPFISQAGYFEGKEGQFFPYTNQEATLLMAGLGKKEEQSPFKLLQSGIKLFENHLKNFKLSSCTVDFQSLSSQEVFFLMEGLFLAAFYENPFKKEENTQKISDLIIKSEHKKSVSKAQKIAESRNLVRTLVDTPANILTTKNFAEKIQEIFASTSITVEVWDKERLEKENMQGLLTVGKGSDTPPYFVKLHYKPQKVEKNVTLVGKGVVFDAGGYSLKPTDSMLDMKGDMAGAATVVGAIHALASLEAPIEVYALLPLAENMISGKAYRVSDVIRYKNGKTVEINNTDAEGRLILADALLYANTLPPKTIIDLATLTGACMVALGPDIYGVFTENKDLSKDFLSFVNTQSSEAAWELPLFTKYKEQLKSSIADLKNTGKRWGGAITAALFLKEFVDKEKTWMHLDIAGPFFDEGLGLFDSMATGIPLESLVLFLEQTSTL